MQRLTDRTVHRCRFTPIRAVFVAAARFDCIATVAG